MTGPLPVSGTSAAHDALQTPAKTAPRIAIVHEWLQQFAGAERVLEQLLILYPQAEIFAVVDFMSEAERKFLGGRKVTTSFIQRLPLAQKMFRNYLGLMPIAVEQFDLAGFDVVISSSHAVAKGVITGPDQIHISYVHSPMRYAWDMQAAYLRQSGIERGPKSILARWILHKLRMWDVRSSVSVDLFVANSTYIRRRIRKAYRRDALVIPPPVDVARFQRSEAPRRDYVVVSRLVPYKRVDLVVEAFRRMPGRRLIVGGTGTEQEKIAAIAQGAPNIELRGRVSDEELLSLMQQARAFVFAAEEDFGIALVEAQACGTPVIAFGRGGARDILRTDHDGATPTGVMFEAQTPESIMAAVERFEAMEQRITPAACRENAERFSEPAFRDAIDKLVNRALEDAALETGI